MVTSDARVAMSIRMLCTALPKLEILLLWFFCFGLVFKTNCRELGFEFVARRSGCPVMASGNWLQRGQGRAKLCLISFKNRC